VSAAQLTWLFRSLVGVTLVTTGMSKLRHLDGFVRDALEYQFGPAPLVRLLAPLIPAVEIGLGAMLLAGYELKSAASVASLLLALFLLATSANLVRARRIRCGCGFAQSDEIGVATVIRQISLFLPSLWLAVWGAQTKHFLPDGLMLRHAVDLSSSAVILMILLAGLPAMFEASGLIVSLGRRAGRATESPVSVVQR
jgi:uncharacterized membrane protein YphA (DoxX/SURF4 family)